MNDDGEKPANDCSRRDFLKGSGALLGGALLASQVEWAAGMLARAEAGTGPAAGAYELAHTRNILYTSCLQCNTGCGIKVKLVDGLAVKIDGSPYSPFTAVPNLPMATSPEESAKVDAAICPKGHAGIQTVYDPYRIRKVLKRAGKRGEGKWTTIPFERAVAEIVDGGKLFAHVPGEEERHVEGLKDIWALRDARLAKAMADDARAIAKAKDRKKAVADFQAKHAANLHLLIDPAHPDLGPKNNQVVFQWGRMKGGRAEFGMRFFAEGLGTVNTHGHTTVCQGSLYFTCKAMSEQYDGEDFAGGRKFYWQGDVEHAEYALFVGANLFDANYGPPNRSARMTGRMAAGELKIAVADPRFSKLASKANRYLPVVPGEDGALFMAIAKRLISAKKYDAKYLSCVNEAAARAAGETTWTNAALLVRIGDDGTPGRFLRASEIGLRAPEPRRGKDGKERPYEFLVVLKDGEPVAVDPNDEKRPATGDLLVDGTVHGVRVKSGLQLVADAANAKTMAEWSALCGIPVADIEAVADELAAHGKRAVVDVHRGVAQHTNGFYNVTAAMTINLLLGNFDHAGGMIAASAYGYMGGLPGQPADLSGMNPGRMPRFGTSVIRHDVRYEDSTLFDGYPAKRNWWPLSSDVYEETIPSIGDGYPYPVKALFSYMAAPTFALPAGQTNIAVLADVSKLPLHVASDILVGPSSTYADYVFPDLSYLERWEMQGSHPNMPAKVQPIRQPVIAPIPGKVVVFGEEAPCSWESLLMALAEQLGMKGFGPGGFGPGQDFTRPDDYYVRMVANVAHDGDPSADADDAEVALFLDSRRHLPRSVFDPARWERIAGPDWRKVVHLLNRGGRFQDCGEIASKGPVANRYGRAINLYQEKTAGTRNAFTGAPNPGHALYVPVRTAMGQTPEEAGLTSGFPLRMITQKDILHTKSRTVADYWTLSMRPENEFVLHPSDAKALGLSDGSLARVLSATNRAGAWELGNGRRKEMIGRVKTTETIRPGVMTFLPGYGHWASGSADLVVDGKTVAGDPTRATGFNANAAMWIDPYLKNTCMIDPVGGSVSFYDTRVTLVKA